LNDAAQRNLNLQLQMKRDEVTRVTDRSAVALRGAERGSGLERLSQTTSSNRDAASLKSLGICLIRFTVH